MNNSIIPNLPKFTRKEGIAVIIICTVIIIALAIFIALFINGYNPTIHF